MLFEKLRKCMKFTLMINVNVLVFIFRFYVCKFLKIDFCILLK